MDTHTNYKKIATEVRRTVVRTIYKAQTSHIGSNLSVIDLATVLYEKINIDHTLSPTRDRVIWSAGWKAATAYAFLVRKGILPDGALDLYGKEGGLLGLVERSTRGIEASTGSMGHGLPIGVGMALAAKRGLETWKTYVIMSDGEMNCGTTWESAALAAHHKLDNLTVLVDVNGWQAMGKTEDVLDMRPLKKKWESFGWHAQEIDGHSYEEIKRALCFKSNLPKVILAHTIKGKGVSEMEKKLEWHYRNIPKDIYERAMTELQYI